MTTTTAPAVHTNLLIQGVPRHLTHAQAMALTGGKVGVIDPMGHEWVTLSRVAMEAVNPHRSLTLDDLNVQACLALV